MSDFSFRTELKRSRDLRFFEYGRRAQEEHAKWLAEEILRTVIGRISFYENLYNCTIDSICFAVVEFDSQTPQIVFSYDSTSWEVVGLSKKFIKRDVFIIFDEMKETMMKDFEIRLDIIPLPEEWKLLDMFSIKL